MMTYITRVSSQSLSLTTTTTTTTTTAKHNNNRSLKSQSSSLDAHKENVTEMRFIGRKRFQIILAHFVRLIYVCSYRVMQRERGTFEGKA
tara:strand:- start:169 stop:438 length:270 start_codon:yes stop_codon:yes gene_type:complete